MYRQKDTHTHRVSSRNFFFPVKWLSCTFCISEG